MSDDDDLTRLEDLSEYLHSEDENSEENFEESEQESVSLSELDDDEEVSEIDVFADDDTQPDIETDSTDFSDDEETDSTDFSDDKEIDSNDFDNNEEGESNLESIDLTEETPTNLNSIPDEKISPKATIIPETPPKESFGDIKSFANNISYGSLAGVGTPPFSILIENINDSSDANAILAILKEYGLLNNSNQPDIEQGIKNGSLLIPQISEYSAIFLGHKFRKLSASLQIGQSSEIHQSKILAGESNKGTATKNNILQNKNITSSTFNDSINIDDIIITTTQTLQGYDIHKYIDIITEVHIIPSDIFEQIQILAEETKDDDPQLNNTNNYIYKQLTNKLREQALKLSGNAIIGVNFHVNPLVIENEKMYEITCSGNVVQVIGMSKDTE